MRAKAILIALVVVAAILLSPVASYASGGSTWKVTVSNPSTYQIRYMVRYGMSIQSDWNYVNPGSTLTYKVPGAHCPFGLWGEMKGPDGFWHRMRDTSCLGTLINEDVWTACCWNVAFKVCQVSGQGSTQFRTDDWAFCK